jgi:Flp pilus assembly protein TadD
LIKGTMHFKNEDYDNAIVAYTSAISIDSACVDAYSCRAKSYTLKGQHEEAITDYSKAISIDPNRGGNYVLRGMAYAWTKEHEKAIKDYDKAISLNSNMSTAYMKRGESHASLEQYGEAVADYSSSLSYDPRNIDAYRRRGNAHLATNNLTKAIEDLSEVIAQVPMDVEALSSRGIAYSFLGDQARAIPDLRKAGEMGDPIARQMLEQIKAAEPKQNQYAIDMNKGLWRDSNAFAIYLKAQLTLAEAGSCEPLDPDKFLAVANMLDDMMQAYERKHGPIEDPLFYWLFATANASFLQIGHKFDEMGPTRIAFAMNGYKEGLNRHLLSPSFTSLALQVAFENIEQMGNDSDKEWLAKNKSKFIPISG